MMDRYRQAWNTQAARLNDSMNCIVWNVQGLGNHRAFQNLCRLLTNEDPSLVFLCETKLIATQCGKLRTTLGFDGCYVQDSEGKKRGLIVLWKEPMKVAVQSSSSGHIDAIISYDERVWRFTGFYGSSVVEKKKILLGFINEARLYFGTSSPPLVDWR